MLWQLLSVLASFGGFALLYFYIKKIEINQTFQLFHYTFDPRHSQALLLIVSAGVGLLFLGTGLINFHFHRLLLRFNYRSETHCIARLYKSVMDKASLLPYQEKEILSPYNIKKSFIKDTKFYARSLFSVIKAVIPIANLILSLAFMFYLS